jgi:hypothetical protein
LLLSLLDIIFFNIFKKKLMVIDTIDYHYFQYKYYYYIYQYEKKFKTIKNGIITYYEL